MPTTRFRRPPGEVRDAVRRTLQARPSGASVGEIGAGVRELIGEVSGSSIRSYLRLNTPQSFARPRRGYYRLADNEIHPDGACSTRRRFRTVVIGQAKVIHGDCMEWLKQQERNSIHAVVTDPPYGLVEYSSPAIGQRSAAARREHRSRSVLRSRVDACRGGSGGLPERRYRERFGVLRHGVPGCSSTEKLPARAGRHVSDSVDPVLSELPDAVAMQRGG